MEIFTDENAIAINNNKIEEEEEKDCYSLQREVNDSTVSELKRPTDYMNTHNNSNNKTRQHNTSTCRVYRTFVFYRHGKIFIFIRCS